MNAMRLLAVCAILLPLVAGGELIVFSASSTTDVMKDLAAAFEARGGESVRFNFAASGTLARQIEAGAPADAYISANVEWMDFLQARGLVDEATLASVAGNALVLVAPDGSSMTFADFPKRFEGMLAIGDPQSVPAGAYAEAALRHAVGAGTFRGRRIKCSNVRTALTYVERGEVDAGIVYASDAMQSGRVSILGMFPADSHPAVAYPAACLKGAGPSAKAFLDFVRAPEARAVWQRYGFSPVGEHSETGGRSAP
jgi:molybdate transport system substrate-binding protein